MYVYIKEPPKNTINRFRVLSNNVIRDYNNNNNNSKIKGDDSVSIAIPL